MNSRILLVFLMLLSALSANLASGSTQNPGEINLLSPEGTVIAVLYDSDADWNRSQALGYLKDDVPVVFYGNNSFNIYELYSPTFIIENRTDTGSSLVASGLWLQRDRENWIEHQVQVYDSSFTQEDMDSIYQWLNETSRETTPTDYVIEALITQIDHHEPYGKLKTETDILRVVDDNSVYDWYDISVTQRLTPGISYAESSWEWSWLQYTMNGSLGSSNVYLSDYDPPPRNEVPEGPFSFLWRILGFDLRDLIPWLNPPEPTVVGVDMSDFSIELFRARYEAPIGYKHMDEPFEIRHHYVLRTGEGVAPRFWHQTQAQYTQSGSFAKVPYITPPLASGYVTKHK